MDRSQRLAVVARDYLHGRDERDVRVKGEDKGAKFKSHAVDNALMKFWQLTRQSLYLPSAPDRQERLDNLRRAVSRGPLRVTTADGRVIELPAITISPAPFHIAVTDDVYAGGFSTVGVNDDSVAKLARVMDTPEEILSIR
jgi:hypothetical protein